MATSVNYSSLFQDITRYAERGNSQTTDPTVYDQIPRLINAAERKLAQDLKLLGQIEVLVDVNALATGLAVYDKPDRWRSTVSINYGSGTGNNSRTFLFPRSYEYCRSYWPDDTVTNVSNLPKFYGDYDLNHWLIVPTPPANFPAEFLCYMQPVLLDEVNQTNFWSDYTPNLLLYGALLEMEPFLKDDPRIPMWKGYWQDEIAGLNTQDLQRIMDRASQRKSV